MESCYLDRGHCLFVYLVLRLRPIHLQPVKNVIFDFHGAYSSLALSSHFHHKSHNLPCVQIMVFSTIQTTSDLFTCPISWPKRKTLPWTSFFRARAAARWLSYSTNMYLRQSPLLKYFFLGYLLSFINTLILSLHPLDLVLSACDG